MEFSREEIFVMIEAINHSISYRLNNRTRMSEIAPLKTAKEKLSKELDMKKEK